MEISVKDIIKAVLKKWYIMFTIVSILTAIGTAIGVNNYTKPKYTASLSFLFSNPTLSNISLYVSNCSAYLSRDYIKYNVSDYIENNYETFNTDYEVTISVISATLEIEVTADSKEVAEAVVEKYGKLIVAPDNPIRKEGLVIEPLVPTYSYEEKPSISSLIIQIGLFGFVGLFIGGLIILAPLYSQKNKELNSEEPEIIT